MVSVDSVAVFMERLVGLGLNELKPKFEARGWTTLGAFAFSSAYKPGGDDKIFVDEVIAPLVESKEDPKVPAIRRLFYEAHAFAAADLNRRLNGFSRARQGASLRGPVGNKN